LKSGCTSGEQEVGKLTLPRAGESGEPCSCWEEAFGVNAAAAQNKNANIGRQNRIISFELSCTDDGTDRNESRESIT